ncbi:hypothetical protein D3C84_994210 [compost metagenome]
MPSKASAEKRVAKPIRISTGKKCSANAAMCAAISGESNGTGYSLLNSGMVESARRGQPNSNVPSIRSIAMPSTLVCPDFQNTAAMENRAIKAIRLCGIKSSSTIARLIGFCVFMEIPCCAVSE